MLTDGQQVDRYRIEGELGRGGMAIVYAATHTRLGTAHAVKVLQVPVSSVRERLLQEGRIQAQLRHPNIVSVTDIIDVQGAPGLVMERVHGPSLALALDGRRLTMAEADAIARAVLAGVAAAHKQGLIHRDLKPGNVLIQHADGGVVVKVTDFGLARLLESESDGMATRSGVSMGTPAYMAPEQFRSARDVDARADVFSLGVLLYELVSGVRPYDGDSLVALLVAAEAESYAPLGADVPARWRAVISRALRPDPARRPADAKAVLEAWGAPVDGPVDWSWVRSVGAEPSGAPFTRDPQAGTAAPLSPIETFSLGLLPDNAAPISAESAGERPLVAQTLARAGDPKRGLWVVGVVVAVGALVAVVGALCVSPSVDERADATLPRDAPQESDAVADGDPVDVGPAAAVFSVLLPGVSDAASLRAAADVLARSSREEWPPRGPVVERVRAAARARGLPDTVVGIPATESGFRANHVSDACSAGVWQFSPETAVRSGLAVSDCVVAGVGAPWSPDPAVSVTLRSIYTGDSGCLIELCREDERLDLALSTEAAMLELGVSWELPELRSHPQRLALTVLSFSHGRSAVLQKLRSADDADLIGAAAGCVAANGCGRIGASDATYPAKVAANAAVALCYGLRGEARPVELCRAAGLTPRLDDVLAERQIIVGLAPITAVGGSPDVAAAVGLHIRGLLVSRSRVIDLAGPDAGEGSGVDVVIGGSVGVVGDDLMLNLERWDVAGRSVGARAYGVGPQAALLANVQAQLAEVLSDSLLDPPVERLMQVVRARQGEVKDCYEGVLRADPALEGRLELQFDVLESGRVSELQIPKDTVGSSDLRTCVRDASEQWLFPAGAPQQGVLLPFSLTSGG